MKAALSLFTVVESWQVNYACTPNESQGLVLPPSREVLHGNSQEQCACSFLVVGLVA